MKKILLISIFSFSHTQASIPTFHEGEKQNGYTCANQVMALAVSARTDKTGTLKKYVYSDNVDRQFFDYFKKMKSIVENVDDVNSANSTVQKNIQEISEDIYQLAAKKTPKTLESCKKFMRLLTEESFKLCPQFYSKGAEQFDKAEYNRCAERAMKNPIVAVSLEEWKFTQKNLIFKQ